MGKKPANSNQKPYASTSIPTTAQPQITSTSPPRKKLDPCTAPGTAHASAAHMPLCPALHEEGLFLRRSPARYSAQYTTTT